MSAIIKLHGVEIWRMYDEGTQTNYPFSFSPVQMQGFSEYQAVIRIILPQTANVAERASLLEYTVIPSRIFAAVQPPFSSITNSPLAYQPGEKSEALLQTRWAKTRVPSNTTQGIKMGFYPYTMVGTFGPSTVGNAGMYQRVWNAKAWMPFSWAWQDPDRPDQARGTTFWGPFMLVKGYPSESWYSVNAEVTLYVQFKGQK